MASNLTLASGVMITLSPRGTGDGKGGARGAVSFLPGGRALRASAGASRCPQSSGAEYSAPRGEAFALLYLGNHYLFSSDKTQI